MMLRATVGFVGIVLLATACKTTASSSIVVTGTPVLRSVPAPPYSPEGKWTLALVAQGQSMEVLLELAKLPDGTWSGTLTSAAFPPIPIAKATLDGKQMLATFAVPTGDTGSMTLTFDGDVVAGEWSMPGDGSKVSGKKM